MLAIWICWLLFLLLHVELIDAAGCEGTANLDAIGHRVCGKFFNETSCVDGLDLICRWDMAVGGCVTDVVASTSCSELLLDNPEDCNEIEGCYWADIPVWVWLAINVPVWLLVALICLICYHKHVGNSRIVVYDRAESITIGSQVTEEQGQGQDVFGNPIPSVVHSKMVSESEASSNETSVLELEDGGGNLSE